MSATSRRCLVKRRPFIQLAIISVVAAVNDGNAYYTATNDIQIYLTGRWRRKRSSIRAFEKKLFPSLHPLSSPFYLLPVFLFLSTLVSSTKKFILQKKNPHGASHWINTHTQDDDFLSKIVPVLSHIGHPLEPLWPTIDKYFTLPDKHFILSVAFLVTRSVNTRARSRWLS